MGCARVGRPRVGGVRPWTGISGKWGGGREGGRVQRPRAKGGGRVHLLLLVLELKLSITRDHKIARDFKCPLF